MDHRTHRPAHRVEGRSAAPGIALGPLVRLSAAKPQTRQSRSAAGERGALTDALEAARLDLVGLADKIDDEDAEATLAARHAQHLMMLEQYQRRSKLAPGYTITVENLDNALRQSETAAANYQQAIASRDTAALNLKRTEVHASVNGFITNLNLAQGTFASQGKPVMALIDSDSYRVEAYFEETKIPQIKAGVSAEIYLMDGSPALQGTVQGIAMGITDQDNPNGPQLLSSINPTFTWVRLAQRIPVGIHITHVPPGVLVSAGMTCTVVMKKGAGPEIGLRIKKVMAAIFGVPSS